MLNRRLLRIKVMQALYALKQSETANYHNAIAIAEEAFAWDLNSMETPDLKLLEQKKQRAAALFENHFKTTPPETTSEEADVTKAVSDALIQFRNQVDKDKKHFSKVLDKEIEGIYESYLLCLSFLDDVAAFAVREEEEKKSRPGKQQLDFMESLLNENPVIKMIRKNPLYISNTKGGKLVWDSEIIRKSYRQSVRTDEEFKAYIENKERNFEDHQRIILHIAKTAIFKDTACQSFFEEKDLNWGENKSIVKNMLVKTLKSVKEDQEAVQLLEISANWEEDKLFYEDLYKYASEKQEELEKMISERIENWDIERLAAIDRIILIMAISEMIHFPSIPVKVSINEYIDLSKTYSTPKSKQFINGILDRLAEDLTKSGLIKKSGRGLIDNK